MRNKRSFFSPLQSECSYGHSDFLFASVVMNTRTTLPQASYPLRRFFYKSHRHAHFARFFSAKGHACFGYLLVNALTTPLLRYQPFADAPAALGELSNPIISLRPKHSNPNLLLIGETFGFVAFLKKLNKSLFVAV